MLTCIASALDAALSNDVPLEGSAGDALNALRVKCLVAVRIVNPALEGGWRPTASAAAEMNRRREFSFGYAPVTVARLSAVIRTTSAIRKKAGAAEVSSHGRKGEPELDRLSNILKTFNENFGTLFADTDRVAKRIREDIAPKVAADEAFQNARDNTPHTARMAHDQALGKVMQILLKDDTQVYKQFVENESFRRFVGDMVYELTSQPGVDRHA